jgi:hypothetical protein
MCKISQKTPQKSIDSSKVHPGQGTEFHSWGIKMLIAMGFKVEATVGNCTGEMKKQFCPLA